MNDSAFNGIKNDSLSFIWKIQNLAYTLEIIFLLGAVTSNITDVLANLSQVFWASECAF